MKKIILFALGVMGGLFVSNQQVWADDCNTPTVSAATITFTYEEMPPEGVTSIKAKFRVGANSWVYFSKGNLRYQPSTQTWKFSENQWDHQYSTGNNNASSSRSTMATWIDLFPWGNPSNPTGTSGSSSFTDWGTRNIQNASSDDHWRTLTKTEWQYLISRKDAKEHYLHSSGTVNGVSGIILLPDNWVMPAGCSFTFLPADQLDGSSYTQNAPTSAQWEKMAEAGAIFLPVTGIVKYSETSGSGDNRTYRMYYGTAGYYWASTLENSSSAQCTLGSGGKVWNNAAMDPTYAQSISQFGCAVRLVLPFTPQP